MFVHHVLFYMSADASDADRAQLATGIRSLLAIESIQMSHLGVPAATNRDVIERGYAYSWLTVFENAAGEEVYQKHPVHLQFIEAYKHLWTKVVIYDAIDF
ncbi:MAG: Dabb family protein [Saprospiraceae bacterium]|nr:Dabb family protein [Saprospiraceae bacterium]